MFSFLGGGGLQQQHRHHFHPIKVISCCHLPLPKKKTHGKKITTHHHTTNNLRGKKHTQANETTNNQQPQTDPTNNAHVTLTDRQAPDTCLREGEDFWQFVLVALQLRQMRIAFLDVPKAVTWKHWPDRGDHWVGFLAGVLDGYGGDGWWNSNGYIRG